MAAGPSPTSRSPGFERTEIIARAIAQRRRLRFEYGGHVREAEPHTYGVDRLSDRALVAYQVSGGSVSGAADGWKMFRENEMRDVTVLESGFRPREGYRRNDPAFASIISQL